METPQLKWDSAGLVTVVVQDAETGEIRMVAHANDQAVNATLKSGDGHFYSRSRQSLWRKGESSGNTLKVREVWADCDGDALIYLVDPRGPSCHTGAETCFYTPLTPVSGTDDNAVAAPTLLRLARTLEQRASADGKRSYTKSLLEKGATKIDEKLREEAAELGEALINESNDRVISESGDVLYHVMVGLVLKKLPVRDLLKELSKRFGTSGHDEKASRS